MKPIALLRKAWGINAPLTSLGVLMVGLLIAAAIGLAVDHQAITGAPAWMKPAKFAISISIYSFTLVWMLTFLRGWPRTVRVVSWVTTAMLLIEMVLIVGAVVGDTTSHFNVSTPLHIAVWSTMASAIVVTWVAALVVAVLLVRQKIDDPVMALALRIGIVVALVGMAVAFLMTTPTKAQLAAAKTTGKLPIVGAHTVGAPDGGPGLPIVGWSTKAGDLRVPHFVGLHGLQALPLFAVLVTYFAPVGLPRRSRQWLVGGFGIGYLGLVALLTWQAERGQSVVHPDALTLLAGAVLAAVVLGVWAAALTAGRRIPALTQSVG